MCAFRWQYGTLHVAYTRKCCTPHQLQTSSHILSTRALAAGHHRLHVVKSTPPQERVSSSTVLPRNREGALCQHTLPTHFANTFCQHTAGLTNAFLIATESPLALRYNDTAPLGKCNWRALGGHAELLPVFESERNRKTNQK
eukprot:1150595-Pelagomonas_calceolata.AAC.2